ncbi:MAG: hypothetical protein ABIO80_05305 [Sphingomicrobium sp.]
MKKIRYSFALAMLTASSAALAMPSAVPATWWDHMMMRFEKMTSNPGFCQTHGYTWVCA